MKDTGAKAEEPGAGTSRLQLELLQGINGAFVPQVLTCLMGVSGAGKTTLMDVLAGRKTSRHLNSAVFLNLVPLGQHTPVLLVVSLFAFYLVHFTSLSCSIASSSWWIHVVFTFNRLT